MTDPISSPTNQRIKGLVRLRNRRERDRTATFLVEGYREVNRALEHDIPIAELFICPEFYLGENEDRLVHTAAAAGAEIIPVAPEPFTKASYRDRPEGLIAVARQFSTALENLDPPEPALILVAESIEKPGNLGTMMRTANAAGVDAVIVCDPTTDPFNPNVVRASLGALFTVPLAVASTEATIAWLRTRGIASFATTPDTSTPHWGADLTGSSALVVGSEQYGLSTAWLDGADVRIVIPMPGSVDSLNAAMAAGVVLFEAVRQRASAGSRSA